MVIYQFLKIFGSISKMKIKDLLQVENWDLQDQLELVYAPWPLNVPPSRHHHLARIINQSSRQDLNPIFANYWKLLEDQSENKDWSSKFQMEKKSLQAWHEKNLIKVIKNTKERNLLENQLQNEIEFLENLKGLIVIDEIQKLPELFLAWH